MKNVKVAIIGASGGVGRVLVECLSNDPSNTVFAFSRSEIKNKLPGVTYGFIDYTDERSIVAAANTVSDLDVIIVATGILHNQNTMMPEKRIIDIEVSNLQTNFFVNAIGPALVAKYFLAKVNVKKRSTFAVLSARVGSISDNHLGGWYSYRASKAALNMLIRTLSIETSRRMKQSIVVGLHPGTVDMQLSEPFQSRVPENKLFSPDYSARCLLKVVSGLSVEDSGFIFAWDGKRIPF